MLPKPASLIQQYDMEVMCRIKSVRGEVVLHNLDGKLGREGREKRI